MPYASTKTYTHAEGLSCCFRQHLAKSHCAFLHGYSLEVRLTFTSNALDERNWVVDFGGLKDIKQWLKDMFDHKTLVAKDDPQLETFKAMHGCGIIDMLIVPAVGCEAFAQMIYNYVNNWLTTYNYEYRASAVHKAGLASVEVREHTGNSAIYYKEVLNG